ncbi:hypothetical protein HED60_18835 [Planctomycetales bacterium ZRK34]|nr:hypothetical protein HED60_18835 [Planctomycetales bacterium ZRK34]
MTSNRLIPIALLTVMLLTGCGDRYEHAELGLDSPQAQQVVAMLDQLHDAAPTALDTFIHDHAAERLTQAQTTALRALLQRIAEADEASLTSIDQFGPQVYRVQITTKSRSKTDQTHALLIMQNDRLLWAGPN